jgi:hypothetical protein
VHDVPTFNLMLSTVQRAFPHTYVLLGVNANGVHVLGSHSPLQFDMPRLLERLAAPAVARDINEWEPVPVKFFAELRPLPAGQFPSDGQLTDDEPALEFNLIRNWRLGTLQPSPTVRW